jgi:hypothetical protein
LASEAAAAAAAAPFFFLALATSEVRGMDVSEYD